jgi:hypothetical protein
MKSRMTESRIGDDAANGIYSGEYRIDCGKIEKGNEIKIHSSN